MPGPITNIATANATSVTVRGRDLVNELIGKHRFTEVFYFLVTGRMPDAAQTRVLDACLVTLMEHGFTPSALIARLTAESVPDQIQVSIGAGLLAVGSVHAGTMEGCAGLAGGRRQRGRRRRLVPSHRRGASASARRRCPGFGHALHKPDDPRTPPLLRVARENGLDGRYVQLLLKLSADHRRDRRAPRHDQRDRRAGGAAARDRHPAARSCGRSRWCRAAPGWSGTSWKSSRRIRRAILVKLARETIPYRNPPG